MGADVMTPGGAVAQAAAPSAGDEVSPLAVAQAAAPSAGDEVSPLVVAARHVAPVLDRLAVRCVSVHVRGVLVDVEGPSLSYSSARPFVDAVEVQVHVAGMDTAARLARVLGVPEASRTVHDFPGTSLEATEHVTWSGVVALPGAPVLLDVEVLALGPAPETKEVA